MNRMEFLYVFFINVVIPGCHPSLEAPVNGDKFAIKIGGFEKYINFHCNPGYSLTGKTLAICEGGKWSTTTPVCNKIK